MSGAVRFSLRSLRIVFVIFAVKSFRGKFLMRSVFAPVLLLLLAPLIFCGPKPSSKSEPSGQGSQRYHLKGKVVSIDKRANMATIEGEDIPGFMGAMVMPYVVKPSSELDKLSPGDAITADVVVQGDNSWIEKVTVASHSTSPAK
jgi:protein SCO1